MFFSLSRALAIGERQGRHKISLASESSVDCQHNIYYRIDTLNVTLLRKLKLKDYLFSDFMNASKIETSNNHHFKPLHSLFCANNGYDSKVSDASDKISEKLNKKKTALHDSLSFF